MRSSTTLTLVVLGAAAALLPSVAAQDPAQLDPAATCPQQVIDNVITPCVAQVYKEEVERPGGACSSSDWPCICSLQSGLISCYDLCAGTQDADAIRFNKEQCNGQNGVRNVQNGGSLGYTFGTLTTTLAGFTSTPVVAATTSVSQPTTTSTDSASSSLVTSVSTTTSAPTSSRPNSTSSSAAPTNTGAATYAAQPPSRSGLGVTLSVAGLLMGALMVVAA